MQIFWVHCGKTWGSGWITWLWPWHWKHLDLQVGIFLLNILFLEGWIFWRRFRAWIFDPGTGYISIGGDFVVEYFSSHRLNIFKNIFCINIRPWHGKHLDHQVDIFGWKRKFLTGWFLRIFDSDTEKHHDLQVAIFGGISKSIFLHKNLTLTLELCPFWSGGSPSCHSLVSCLNNFNYKDYVGFREAVQKICP